MNPSRLFILRPVGTSLLMAAILLVGIVAYGFLPVSALPEVDYPDHPGADLLSRRQPGGDDLVGHRAAGTAVRPDAGPEPDVVDQFGRGVGHHAAVQPGSEPRHRRAGGAGGDQCGRQSAAVRSAGAADLRQGQSRRRADPDAGADLQDAAADAGRGPRRHAAGAEDLAAAGRRAGEHQRRPAAGGAHPGQSARAGRLRAEHRRPAHHARQCQRQHAEGQLRRPAQATTINANDQITSAAGLQQPGDRLSQRRAGAADGRRDRGAGRGEHQAWRLGQPHAGGHPEHPAPARRQRHPGGRQHQEAAAGAAGDAARRRSTSRC